MSTLLVSPPLHPATSATEWGYALTSDGRSIADHGVARAALLPLPRGAGAEVVLVVPVRALAWHRVELPKGIAAGTPRLRAALDGLLEEQLLDETEAVHLAVAPGARGGERVWVAACDRAWLRGALQVLEAAGRGASRIVPEFAPEGAPALTALGDAEQPLVVASSAEAVLMLPLTKVTLPLLPALAADTEHFAEPSVAAVAYKLLPDKWRLQQAPKRWVRRSSRTRWDLAQFEFASSPRDRAFKKFATVWNEVLHSAPWRAARWAAVLLFAVNLVGLNALAWKERAGLARQQEAIRATLKETFPQVKVIIDAPVQMEREVAALRQQTGAASARDLDALLATLAAALPAGRAPARLDFGGGQLRAAGLALTPAEFSSVATQLKALGYSASREGDLLVVAAEDTR